MPETLTATCLDIDCDKETVYEAQAFEIEITPVPHIQTILKIDSTILESYASNYEGEDYRKDYPTWFSLKLQCKPKIAIIIEVNKKKVELDLRKHFTDLEAHYIIQCLKQFYGWYSIRESCEDADVFNILDFTFENGCKPYPTGLFSKIFYRLQEYKNLKELKK